MKRLLKRMVPPALRRGIRELQRELPIRLRDLPADLSNRDGLPPAALRRRVGRSSSRSEFVADGRKIAGSILAELERQRIQPATFRSLLDFGCGCGRVARFLAPSFANARYSGVDIDVPAVEWCARHLEGAFRAIAPGPPLPFDAGTFDFIHAVSVFTHLDEAGQFVWLEELHRVLAPDGVLLVTLHSPRLVTERKDLGAREHARLERDGFLFAAGEAAFNDHSAFHRRDYVEREWRRWFRLVSHEEFALGGYQDIAILKKAG
jgi:SAM-dependent methyltransferase